MEENNRGTKTLVAIVLLFSSIFFFVGLASFEGAYRAKNEVVDYEAMSKRIDEAQKQLVELKLYCNQMSNE